MLQKSEKESIQWWLSINIHVYTCEALLTQAEGLREHACNSTELPRLANTFSPSKKMRFENNFGVTTSCREQRRVQKHRNGLTTTYTYRYMNVKNLLRRQQRFITQNGYTDMNERICKDVNLRSRKVHLRRQTRRPATLNLQRHVEEVRKTSQYRRTQRRSHACGGQTFAATRISTFKNTFHACLHAELGSRAQRRLCDGDVRRDVVLLFCVCSTPSFWKQDMLYFYAGSSPWKGLTVQISPSVRFLQVN